MRNLPVYQIAEEIYDLAGAITAAIKDGDQKEWYTTEIMSNATMILGKIAGASGMGLYSLKMYNAIRIRVAIQEMMNAVICTEMFDIGEEDYVQLMRDKVEEFRLVFVEWIRGFDKSMDIPDGWAIRFDTSTPEQEKLEELMFDEDKFYDSLEKDADWDEDTDIDDSDEEAS